MAVDVTTTPAYVSGDAVPVAEVGRYAAFGFFAASGNGTLVYRRGGGLELQLNLFDRQGKTVGITGEPADYSGPASFSPDGKQVAANRRDRQAAQQKTNVWLLDLARDGAATRFTFDAATDTFPVWSPDGTSIVFASNRDGAYNLYRKPAGGAKDEELLLKSALPKHPQSWSRDGRFLLFAVNDPKNKQDLWILPDPGGSPGSQKSLLFQGTAANEPEGQFSPDGRWIAYMSDETGRYEVYVREFVLDADGKPQATAKRQISSGGGAAPTWRDYGKELIFYGPDRRTVLSAEISTRPAFRAAQPRALFQFPVALPIQPEVSPDGQRFLAALPARQKGPEPFTVVLNFRSGLKR
jgi:Tol biopolymer transport system component